MIASLIFFYLPSVSKSLLIVLGTLPIWKPYSWARTRCAWHTPLAPRSMRARFPLFCKFYRMPVCPCQGSWRENQLLRLCVKCPILDCLAWRRSLDNSCPSSCCRKASGKTKLYFFIVRNGRVVVLLASAPARAPLHTESHNDTMRAIGQGMKG